MHRINRQAPVRQNTATPRASRGQQCAPRLTLFPFTHAQGQPRAREGQGETEEPVRSEGLGSEAEVTQLPRQARANSRTQHHHTTRLTPDFEPQLSLLGGPSAGGAEGEEDPSEALPELSATENTRTFAEEIALRYEELAQGDQMEPIVLAALGARDPRNRNTWRPSWAGMLTGVAATLASVNSPINRLTSDLAARDFTRGLDLGPNLGKSVPSAVTLVDEIREPTREEESLAGFELDTKSPKVGDVGAR